VRVAQFRRHIVIKRVDRMRQQRSGYRSVRRRGSVTGRGCAALVFIIEVHVIRIKRAMRRGLQRCVGEVGGLGTDRSGANRYNGLRVAEYVGSRTVNLFDVLQKPVEVVDLEPTARVVLALESSGAPRALIRPESLSSEDDIFAHLNSLGL